MHVARTPIQMPAPSLSGGAAVSLISGILSCAAAIRFSYWDCGYTGMCGYLPLSPGRSHFGVVPVSAGIVCRVSLLASWLEPFWRDAFGVRQIEWADLQRNVGAGH